MIARGDHQPYAVSAAERYLQCPFTFFARDVLGLEAEQEDSPTMTAMARGRLLHEVFREFFAVWSRDPGGAVTPGNLTLALRCFRETSDRLLREVPEPDRSLERARLLGSPVAVGLGERLLRMEAESPVRILDRLLEHVLEGEFVLGPETAPRRLRLKAIADRIDLRADGGLRLVDYKLGRAPKLGRSVQLPIYGVCAEQRLEARLGRRWHLTEAAYLAFGTRETLIPLARPSVPAARGARRGPASISRSHRGHRIG